MKLPLVDSDNDHERKREEKNNKISLLTFAEDATKSNRTPRLRCH